MSDDATTQPPAADENIEGGAVTDAGNPTSQDSSNPPQDSSLSQDTTTTDSVQPPAITDSPTPPAFQQPLTPLEAMSREALDFLMLIDEPHTGKRREQLVGATEEELVEELALANAFITIWEIQAKRSIGNVDADAVAGHRDRHTRLKTWLTL